MKLASTWYFAKFLEETAVTFECELSYGLYCGTDIYNHLKFIRFCMYYRTNNLILSLFVIIFGPSFSVH